MILLTVVCAHDFLFQKHILPSILSHDDVSLPERFDEHQFALVTADAKQIVQHEINACNTWFKWFEEQFS